MKKWVTIMLICFGFGSYAQSLKVVDTELIKRGTIGEKMEVIISIQNTSDVPVMMIAERVTNQIGAGQNSYFCWAEDCFEPERSSLPNAQRIDPGETVSNFVSVLEAGLSQQYSNISYRFINRENPLDQVIVDLDYIVEEKLSTPFLFESSKIQINDVYPNPVTDFAIIDYRLKDEEADAKIILHNVLGSIMGEYQLSQVDNQLKIVTHEFNPGIYFYTLYIDNKGLITGKLVIRK